MDKVSMRTIDDLWENIVIEGLKNNTGHEFIRNSLIDAMRKEIFDQIMFRAGVEDMDGLPENPKNVGIVSNVFSQGIKKWRSLVKKCNQYQQTMNMINEDDLDHIWDKQDDEEAAHDPYIDEGSQEWTDEELDEDSDWDGDEATAEWPELSKEEVIEAISRNYIPVIDAYKESDKRPDFIPDQAVIDAAKKVMTNKYSNSGDTDGDTDIEAIKDTVLKAMKSGKSMA